MATKKRPAKSRIVAAVGVAVSANLSGNFERAARVEKAMSDAVLKAMADGITDPAEQRALMIAARDAAMNEVT